VSPARSALLLSSFSGEELFISTPESPEWIVPVPSGAPRRLGDVVASAAAWSRGGKRLASCRGHDISLAPWDGTQPHKILTIAGDCRFIQFSPDGRRLRFSGFDPGAHDSRIWDVGVDGSALHQLLPESFHVQPGEWAGRWSADGAYYFFTAVRGERTDTWAL